MPILASESLDKDLEEFFFKSVTLMACVKEIGRPFHRWEDITVLQESDGERGEQKDDRK